MPKNLLVMDFESLGHLREELALEAHLFNAELKQRWGELEQDWAHLSEHVRRVEVAAETAGQEVSAATGLLLQSLKHGYQSVRQALRN